VVLPIFVLNNKEVKMPYSTLGKHEMLKALKGTNPTTPITHAGLYDESAALTGVTGVAATDIFTKVGHGLSNGNLVVLRSLSGGSGLREEYPYFIIGVTADTFQLSEIPGGSAFNFTTDVTSASVVKLVELSGGSPAYARKSVTFSDPVEGSMDSSNQPVFDCAAGAVVNYVGFFSALTAGVVLGIDQVTEETFGAQGTYTLLDADLDLNA
jgi:hypothetical protein